MSGSPGAVSFDLCLKDLKVHERIELAADVRPGPAGLQTLEEAKPKP